MQRNQNTYLIIKILLVGGFITSLIYLFHPEAEQFSLIINGEPVAERDSSVLRGAGNIVYESGKSCEAVVQEQGYSAAADFDLEAVCTKVIEANPKPVADVKGGKTQAVQALVGQVMRETKGSADPNAAREMLLKLLGVE